MRAGTPYRAARVAADLIRILGFSGVAAVSRYTTPPPPSKKPCRTSRPSTARGVALQAASEKVSLQPGVAATLAGVALHLGTEKTT